jgi:two-component system, OmpR family, sensor histidine kinase MprB
VSLRARLTLLAAAAVAAAIALASVAAFLITRAELRHQVDRSLVQLARGLSAVPEAMRGRLLSERPSNELEQRLPTIGAQLILHDGSAEPVVGQAIPVDEVDRAVARGERGAVLRDRRAAGVHLRVITVPVQGADSGALQFARPLTEEDRTLGRLALVLGLVAVAGVVGSAMLGLVVARAGLAPVDRLTDRAEHVARTQDLAALIEVRGSDEVARLAGSFNAMLGALDDSRRRQRRLVADAGHELRTPLTSLRTNIELLVHADVHPERTLAVPDRRALLVDLTAQLHELSELVADLVDTARDEASDDRVEDVQLADLVAGGVERARLRAPAVRFDVDLQPAVLRGRRQLLERAVTNVLDNAAKWSPKDGTVEVWLRGGELTVRDHGPGIAGEDLPFVFDRFYRAAGARHLPGAGLGLAIVREAVQAHGGTVSVSSPPGGGTTVRLRLPTVAQAAAAR